MLAEGRLDVAGVCDATQVAQVFDQWERNPRSRWKGPLLRRALAVFHGKRSIPYAPDSIHNFMHAKVTVADDTTFLGSFNLSRSGETNAENVLEISDPALAERMADWIDGLRARYPPVIPRVRRVDDPLAHLAGAYERAAPTYERAGVAHHAPFSERLAQLVLLGPGGRVLDVGCGAGGALLPAARRVGPTGEAVGIDIAPGMVERTRAAAEEAGLEQVRAEVMDGAALDGFEDESFDAVLAAFTLAAIPDAERALAEWRRVLRPTGMLGVAVWTNLVDDAWAWERELNDRFAPEVAAGAARDGRPPVRALRRGAAAARGARARRLPRRRGRDEARRPDVRERRGVVGVDLGGRLPGVPRGDARGRAGALPRRRRSTASRPAT